MWDFLEIKSKAGLFLFMPVFLTALGMYRWPDPSYCRRQRRWNSLELKLAANNNWINLPGGGYIKEKQILKKSHGKTTGR